MVRAVVIRVFVSLSWMACWLVADLKFPTRMAQMDEWRE